MHSPRSTLVALFVAALGAGSLVAAPLCAAEPTPEKIAEARRRFDEGKVAEGSGRWRAAAEKFRQAVAIKDTPGLRFHLARCAEELGGYVEALAEYDRARALLDSGVIAADVERFLPEARARVLASLAHVSLRLPQGASGVRVSVDGRPISLPPFDAPLALDPGQHRLVVMLRERVAIDQQLALAAGEHRELTVALPPRVTPEATPRRRQVAARIPAPSAAEAGAAALHPRTVVLLVEASLLAAGLGTGVGFAVARASANDRLREANERVVAQVGSDPDGSACSVPRPVAGCAQLAEARDDRRRAATLSTVGFVTAGVSAAALGATWLLWPRRAEVVQAHARVGDGEATLWLTVTY